MLRKALMLSLFAVILCGSVVMAQYDRDEVLQITYPTTGLVIGADSVEVDFNIASYFTLGEPGCTDCDGYLVASMNGLPVGEAYADAPFVVSGLTDGYFVFMLEAVDPTGASFMPAVWDTVMVSVMYEESFCPPAELSVSSNTQYEALVLNWVPPAGTSTFEDVYESFDEGLPEDWTVIDGGASADTWFWTTDDAGNTLDGTPFIFVDSDAAGIGVAMDEIIETPVVNTTGLMELYLSFDQYLNYLSGEICDVDVFDGSDWVNVASYTTDMGSWTLPDHQLIDVSEYVNVDFKVRFHYFEANWDWYWAVDNVMLTAEAPETTWMYVYELTPDGWAAQNMTKEEFRAAYPQGLTTEQRIDMSTVELITIPQREDILSCGNLTGYDIFKENDFLANVDTNFYVDEAVTVGTPYCYFVQAVYDSSDSGVMVNSVSTDTLCGTPEFYVPAPITNLSSFALDEEVVLSWSVPGTPTYLFMEDFSFGLPPDWTVVDGGNTADSWVTPSPRPLAGFGDYLFAICDSDEAGSGDVTLDESLIMPSQDFTGYANPHLQITTYYNDIAANDSVEFAAIDVSIDGGTNWTNLVLWDDDIGTATAPAIEFVDLSVAGNESDVQIRFRYADGGAWAWYWAIDDVIVLDGPPPTAGRNEEGDLVQYNIYVDGTLVDSSDITAATVTGLTNDVTYDLGVTALYYPAYESDPVAVSDTPIWLYGDIEGVITDPGGNTLDSAVVRAGGLSDTTEADGYYFLKNLNPGNQTVTVSRDGFDGSSADVVVTAVEAAAVQDFMMIPKLGKPRNLVGYGGDMEVNLAWNSPGGMDIFELGYDDGTWETSITGGADDIEVAVKFTPGSAGELVGGRFVFSSVGQTGYTLDPVELRVYTIGADGMPGDLVWVDDSFTEVPEEDVWIDIDLSAAAVSFDETGFFLGYRFTADGGPGTARDSDGYVYGHSFVKVSGAWTEAGDLGFPGNFIIRAMAGLADAPRGSVQELVTTAAASEEFSKSPLNLTQLPDVNTTPFNITGNRVQTFSRNTDIGVLIGYKVFQIETGGDILVAETTIDDTTATITVPANYVEYCYEVKAVWDTDVYDTLDSKPSNSACVVPYLPGDIDFVGGVDILDVLLAVDFALGTAYPTPDQLRGGDINRDGVINIQDIIMIVDIIFPPSAARTVADAAAPAILELAYDADRGLTANLEYEHAIRGIQFTINYDARRLSLAEARLAAVSSDAVFEARETEPGKLTILAADISGDVLNLAGNSLVTIPVKVQKNTRDAISVTLDNITLVGADGQAIPTLDKSFSIDIKTVPLTYALHQNFPNPFNPTTDIMFDIPKDGFVNLTIYNLTGQKVKTLVSRELNGGYHEVRWNGTNEHGAAVATGVYFYRLEAGSYQATKKMVLLK